MELADDDLCICGHKLLKHHRSWLWGGHLLLEECEYYSTNENSGMAIDEATGRYVVHCMQFQLNREANHGPSTDPES